MLEDLENVYIKLTKFIKKQYLLYTLNTYISICEPWEKVFINTLFLSVIMLFIFVSYLVVPHYIDLIAKNIYRSTDRILTNDTLSGPSHITLPT